MRPALLRNSGAAFAAFMLVALAHPAAAQEQPVQGVQEQPVEAALRAWVSAIDLTPDWRAAYGGLAVDPSTGDATITDLTVTAEQPGFGLTVGRVTVTGYSPTADGTFAARAITVDDGRVDAGVYSMLVDHAEIEAPVLPTTGTFVWDAARPFGSAFAAFAPLVAAKANGARINTATVSETIEGIETRSTYEQVVVEGIHDGKIASVTAGPLRTDSPVSQPAADGSPELPPLVTMTAASSETRDIDMNAILSVYDPGRYANGAGDGVWRTSVGHAGYRDIALSIVGIEVTIGSIAFDDFRLRQMKTPRDFDTPPPATGTGAISDLVRELDALAPYGVRKFTLADLDVKTPGIDRMHVGGLTLTEASTDSIGSFAATGVEGGIGGQGLVKIGTLAFSGLKLPPFGALADAVDAKLSGGDIDVSALLPPLTSLEVAGVDVAVNTLPPLQLGRLRLDLANYADNVPTSVSATLEGADVPTSAIPNARAQSLLSNFGYDRVHLDGGGKLDWSAGGDITVRNFSVGMKGVGLVFGEADLAGLTPAEAATTGTIDDAIAKLSVKRGIISFKDDSIVGRGIAAQAKAIGVDPVKFREQFAKGLPFMLMILGDRSLQAQLAPVLQAFITTPGTITARGQPAAPVPLSQVIAAAKSAPFTLFGLLGVSVSGMAGPASPAPAQ